MFKYFSLLLRLGPEERITGFSSQGNNLVITYTTPAPLGQIGGRQIGKVAGSSAAGNA